MFFLSLSEYVPLPCSPVSSLVFSDPSLTAKNLCSVLDKVEEWWRVCRALRLPRPTQRRLGKDPSTRIQAAADWWLQYSPDAAWKNLALKLYRWEQRAAMKEASEYFQKENGKESFHAARFSTLG